MITSERLALPFSHWFSQSGKYGVPLLRLSGADVAVTLGVPRGAQSELAAYNVRMTPSRASPDVHSRVDIVLASPKPCQVTPRLCQRQRPSLNEDLVRHSLILLQQICLMVAGVLDVLFFLALVTDLSSIPSTSYNHLEIWMSLLASLELRSRLFAFSVRRLELLNAQVDSCSALQTTVIVEAWMEVTLLVDSYLIGLNRLK
ncbi:hypothetical protein BDZ89DRAFT_1049951 [Hymenopellis radicata]|nr:hypothetical protein BDZ89DRAFT_1049951 [Hymenopellis radicata]